MQIVIYSFINIVFQLTDLVEKFQFLAFFFFFLMEKEPKQGKDHDPDLRELFSQAYKLENPQWTSFFNQIPYHYYCHAWETVKQNFDENILNFNFLVSDYLGKEEALYNVVVLYILIYYFNGFGNNRVNFNNKTRGEIENEIQDIFKEFHRILVTKQSEKPRSRVQGWKRLSQDQKVLSVDLCFFQVEEHSSVIQSSISHAMKRPTIEILAFDIKSMNHSNEDSSGVFLSGALILYLAKLHKLNLMMKKDDPGTFIITMPESSR